MYESAIDEETLKAQLRQARERLEALVQDLRAVDRELDGLSGEQPSYRLLEEACGALEQLNEQGEGGLFWGGGASGGEEHLRVLPDDWTRNLDEYRALREKMLQQHGSLRHVDLRWQGRVVATPMNGNTG